MYSSKPRPSLLRMFDPLEHSESSEESNKENKGSPSVSLFTIRPSHVQTPPTLRKRLVDVGDATMEDASLFINANDSEDDLRLTPLARRNDQKVVLGETRHTALHLLDLDTPRNSPMTSTRLPTAYVTPPCEEDDLLDSAMGDDQDDLASMLCRMKLSASTITLSDSEPVSRSLAESTSRRDSINLEAPDLSSFDLLKVEMTFEDTDISFGTEVEEEARAAAKNRAASISPPNTVPEPLSPVRPSHARRASRPELDPPPIESIAKPRTERTIRQAQSKATPAVAEVVTKRPSSRMGQASRMLAPGPTRRASIAQLIPPILKPAASTRPRPSIAKPAPVNALNSRPKPELRRMSIAPRSSATVTTSTSTASRTAPRPSMSLNAPSQPRRLTTSASQDTVSAAGTKQRLLPRTSMINVKAPNPLPKSRSTTTTTTLVRTASKSRLS